MSYQVYKILHVVMIVVFFSSMAMSSVRKEKSRSAMIITGLSLVMILVSGMGLVARIGIPHGVSWPVWLNIKVAIWAVVGIGGHVVMKRFPAFLSKFFWLSIGLLVVASYMANYKIG